MAGTANAVDYKWYQYTDDDGGTWSYRTDKTWGDNAASGMGAFDAADQAWPTTGIYRPRRVQLQDEVSGRKTKRVLGSAGASAGVKGATVVTVARGQTGSYTLTSQGQIGERKPKTGTIISKAEPITT